ncbi:hypothetical protein OG239_00310 [Streptomyces sp. NBC_00868]|uniref:hypothetical protein n=1 Tax=unclassified Streptomyces TaxID=2593676 RepID=UPI0032456C99|nr:hypothetical protein OG239_00310 [Streptomyces sp. NBC_00868]
MVHPLDPFPIRTLVDTHLDSCTEIWAGAGLRHAVFRTTFNELLKLTGGQAADVGNA